MDIGSLTGRIALEDQLSSHLTTITSHVRQFARNFSSEMVASAAGVGVLVAAIAGAGRSILELGEKGSVILGVEESFDRLARAAGSTGEALLRGLSEGVKSTLDSMVLMQSTNRLLSSGIKLTEADMRLMGATAREMGKATGTDAAGGLNTLSQALLTGNTRSLKRFGINIDLVKAEKDFAKSLGTTRDQLSQTGIVEARRIAMLEGMRTKLQTLGQSEVSFKEKVQQSRVVIGNWFDDLAKGVARSTAVSRAFDTIRDALVKTFGGTADTLLKSILNGVDKFADGVTSIGPAVIQVIGNIKNSIVAIWNEIVAFNERWQITNNIIAAAKFAWGLLEKAFYLVRTAVLAVMQAWNAMPEWLQRITRTALEGSIALAAYSIAVQGVAVPFRAMIGSIDLGINIIGNLTGAVVSSMLIWPKLVLQYNLGTAALTRYTVAVRMSTVGHVIETAVLKSVWLARVDLQLILIGLTNAYTALTARILMNSVVLKAYALWVNIVKTAQALWAVTVAAVSTAYTGLIARLGLATVALRASSVATGLATIAMETFGFVILGIQALPLIAALTGIVLGIGQIITAFKNLRRAHEEGKTTWEFLSAKDNDTWARRWINYFTQFAFGADLFVTSVEKMDKARRLKGGAAKADFLPTISPGALAVGSAELQAARAERERLEKRAQGIGLTNDPESFIKESTAAEDFLKKVRDQAKAFAEAGQGAEVFQAAFKSLNKTQRDNYDIQQMLVPEIDKLAAAHKALTPEMIRVRDAATTTRLALLEKDRITLEASDLTSGQIEQMKRLGLSEADIAFQYGVTVEALARRNTAMQEAAQREQNLASFNNALVEQEAQARARREALANAGNKAISDANDELNEFIRAQTMTTTDFQIDQINREATARIVTFKGEAGQAAVFNAIILALAKRRTDALRVDNDALKANSKTTFQEIADKARRTYLAMEADPANYSKETRRHFRLIAEEAARAANDTRNRWKKAWDQLVIDSRQVGLDLAQGIATSLAEGIKTGDWSQFENQLKESLSQAMSSIASSFVNFFVPGLGTALKPLFQAISDKLLGALGLGTKGRDAIRAFWDAEYGGFAGLQRRLEELGPTGQRLLEQLGRVGRDNEKQAAAAIEAIKTELDALDTAVQKYNLTWLDLADGQRAATKAGTDLVATYKRLTSAGYTVDRITTVMSDDFNQFIVDAVRAGTKIPAAMRPIIETLIKTGKLSDSAAKAILGIAETAIPSLEDIRGAAERYGITLDELGPKVKQLEITELANQYVADWQILTAATDDWSVLFDKMGPKVQDLVTDAMRYSLELPSAMKPMIQAWIDQGRLVDAAGEKLTDLSKLTFAADLSEMFETLMTKLDELIDKISGGVGGALDNLGRRPRMVLGVDVEYNVPEPPTIAGARAATGGTVYAAGGSIVPFSTVKPFSAPKHVVAATPFIPKGTDTVPAMLTPGEIVLNAGQQRNIATMLNSLDDNVMTKVRSMLDEIQQMTVAKIEIPLVGELEKITVPKIQVPDVMIRAKWMIPDPNVPDPLGKIDFSKTPVPDTPVPETQMRERSEREFTQIIELHDESGRRTVRKVAKGLPSHLRLRGVR